MQLSFRERLAYARDARYREDHYRRFGMWPKNVYWYQAEARQYRQVIGGPPWPFRNPATHVLLPESRQARQVAEVKARAARRGALIVAALWIGLPLAVALYLWRAWGRSRDAGTWLRMYLESAPVAAFADAYARIFAISASSLQAAAVNKALFGRHGYLGPEVAAVFLGLVIVLVALGLLFGSNNAARSKPSALKTLAVEILYRCGCQAVEGARVIDPIIPPPLKRSPNRPPPAPPESPQSL